MVSAVVVPATWPTPLSETDLRNYIRLLDRQGIAFIISERRLFRQPRMDPPWQKKVTALLGKLA